jgi:hypothetical protein
LLTHVDLLQLLVEVRAHLTDGGLPFVDGGLNLGPYGVGEAVGQGQMGVVVADSFFNLVDAEVPTASPAVIRRKCTSHRFT